MNDASQSRLPRIRVPEPACRGLTGEAWFMFVAEDGTAIIETTAWLRHSGRIASEATLEERIASEELPMEPAGFVPRFHEVVRRLAGVPVQWDRLEVSGAAGAGSGVVRIAAKSGWVVDREGAW